MPFLGMNRRKITDYESNINKSLGDIVGAVLNKQLRLMPLVIHIPKQITKSEDRVIILEGWKVTLPAGTHITTAAAAVS